MSIYNGNGILKRLGSTQGEIDDGQTDSVDYVVHFRPPIEASRAKNVHVSVTYQGEMRLKTRELFGQFVWPTNQTSTRLIFKPGQLEYETFQTHQLRIEKTVNDEELVCSLYFRLVNVTTVMVPQYDLHLCAEVELDDALPWFPPDVDPQYWGIKIDTRLIPQRSHLWFKLRGAMTGSLAYKMLGYFQTMTSSPKDKTKMRLGTYSETDACTLYLHYNPHCKLQEVGWCNAHAPYPTTWGASPDRLIDDDGILEIKTSSDKTSMEDYFYPQCYMEMIATERSFTHLMRYRPNDVAFVYHVARDPVVEEMLIVLWKRALATREADLPALFKSADFVKARDILSKMASDANWECTRILKMTPECMEKIRAQHNRMEQLRTPIPAPNETLMPDVDDELYEKSLELARAVKSKRPKTEITQLMAQQMNLFSYL